MATDANSQNFNVGDIVNIPCVVTAISSTVGISSLTLTTKYAGSDGNTESVSGMQSSQAVVSK